MSSFTDRLYRQWRRSSGGSGVLLTTGRPALPFAAPKKAKRQRFADAGASVHKPTEKESNHGISKV
ncbi:hypothetical protein EII20_10680 [Comamonadaceae bacterium OH2545_COT-014]|nr:hypothetical protein EII20_10680 [Comamonadaceae bacterium OH2545_COT-014]